MRGEERGGGGSTPFLSTVLLCPALLCSAIRGAVLCSSLLCIALRICRRTHRSVNPVPWHQAHGIVALGHPCEAHREAVPPSGRRHKRCQRRGKDADPAVRRQRAQDLGHVPVCKGRRISRRVLNVGTDSSFNVNKLSLFGTDLTLFMASTTIPATAPPPPPRHLCRRFAARAQCGRRAAPGSPPARPTLRGRGAE